MYYNARWYDPCIMQFNQPDTLIPEPYNTLDWNRYSYARGNPLKYSDPSGHLTDNQIEKWTGLKIKNIDADLLKMLRAARLGDALYGYDKNGKITPYGNLWLDDTGHLVFGTTSIYELMTSGMAGWMLTRKIGDTNYLAYHTGGYENPSDIGEEGLYPLGDGTEETVSVLGKLAETTVGGAIAGLAAEAACKGCSKGVLVLATSLVGFVHGVGDLMFRSQPGDQTLTYYYEDASGKIWQQIVVVRDGQVISYQVFPYSTPWYAQGMK